MKGRPRKLTDEERLERKKRSSIESYHRNKEKRLANVKSWQERNREKFKKMVRDRELRVLKEFEEWKTTLQCSKCSEKHVACLEFHHLDPEQKDTNISNLRNSKKKRDLELKKCIILCSNCHRKLHYEERQRNKL